MITSIFALSSQSTRCYAIIQMQNPIYENSVNLLMKSAITASLKLIRPSQKLTAQVRQAFATNPFDNPYGDKSNKVKSNKNNGPSL